MASPGWNSKHWLGLYLKEKFICCTTSEGCRSEIIRVSAVVYGCQQLACGERGKLTVLAGSFCWNFPLHPQKKLRKSTKFWCQCFVLNLTFIVTVLFIFFLKGGI